MRTKMFRLVGAGLLSLSLTGVGFAPQAAASEPIDRVHNELVTDTWDFSSVTVVDGGKLVYIPVSGATAITGYPLLPNGAEASWTVTGFNVGATGAYNREVKILPKSWSVSTSSIFAPASARYQDSSGTFAARGPWVVRAKYTDWTSAEFTVKYQSYFWDAAAATWNIGETIEVSFDTVLGRWVHFDYNLAFSSAYKSKRADYVRHLFYGYTYPCSVTWSSESGFASETTVFCPSWDANPDPKSPYLVGDAYQTNSALKTISQYGSSYGYTFQGWYTKPSGGTQVNSKTKFASAETTYYAQWKKTGSGTAPKATISKVTKVKAKVGKRQVKLTWKKAPAAQKVTGYQVQYKLKGATKWSSTKKVAKSKTAYTIKKLGKGKKYQVRVRAYKGASSGAWVTKTTAKVK